MKTFSINNRSAVFGLYFTDFHNGVANYTNIGLDCTGRRHACAVLDDHIEHEILLTL
ncbi:hypothetical protein [Curvivirga sp.]|uniref:hypothetical protein n=1 Tax=Curvivirga sp. TaxID=2856848 RepID=UPI003B5CE78D